MIGVTADANIYVSGLQFGGVPLRFLDLARSGEFTLFVSEPLFAEVRRVLCDKFQWPIDALVEAVARLSRFTTLTHPTQTLDAVPADPDDNKVLECAVESRSHFIVTGDNDLLRLGSYSGIPIVKVAAFLTKLPINLKS